MNTHVPCPLAGSRINRTLTCVQFKETREPAERFSLRENLDSSFGIL